MMARLSSSRQWDKNVRLDGEGPRLDDDNVIHQAVKAQIIRNVRNGEYDDMANLQKVAGMVSIHGEQGPVKVGEINVTTLKDSTGKLHEIRGDATLVKTFINTGCTLVSVKKEDIFDE